ncbi:MAG TPA: NAD-dependent epimerase/dehydratase family protein [Rhodothermia bacterium]|nr:NAD-dependent epimerase/dehydratase family protein [Rhodothermia bacterium]
MKRILITGARGQIGSDLVLALRQTEADPYVVGTDLRGSSDSDRNGENLPFEHLDVTDRNALFESIKRHRIDTIYHLASLLSAKGEREPDLAWKVNIEGLRNVLELARETGLQVFWPSSIAVFGPGLPDGRAEQQSALVPRTMYGVTKVAGELLCNYYHLRFGVDVRSLRYPGLISYSAPPGGGTTDYAVEIFHAAAEGRPYTSFLVADQRLPMMHMEDAIRASIEIMLADQSDLTVRTSYNLSAVSFSPSEVAEEIRRHIPGFECSYEPDFRQRIAETWPESVDDRVARRDWGWKHRYDLPGIVTSMLDHLIPSRVTASTY